MKIDRRKFFQIAAAGAATGLAAAAGEASTGSAAPSEETMGMLVDTTECIGCRKCEYACNHTHKLPHKPLEAYEETSAYDRERRMQTDAYTVVNRYPNPDDIEKPTYVKSQCMHCLEPACVSACLVGSLIVNPNGAVTYDAWKCIGCRYCMVACPFEVPAYEYLNPLTPEVRKCDFCIERREKEGKIPACAEMCPPTCLTFGKRSELLKLAHDKIAASPERYHDYVYGEKEVGGTNWLYLAGRDFDEIGFLILDSEKISSLTETIQHNVFKYGIPPVMLFGLLTASMVAGKNRDFDKDQKQNPEGSSHVREH